MNIPLYHLTSAHHSHSIHDDDIDLTTNNLNVLIYHHPELEWNA